MPVKEFKTAVTQNPVYIGPKSGKDNSTDCNETPNQKVKSNFLHTNLR